MITRALILRQKDSGDDAYEVSWNSFHPGDAIEQHLISIIQDRGADTIHTLDGRLIYTTRSQDDNSGFAVVLNTIEDDIFQISLEAQQWAEVVTKCHETGPLTREDYQELVEQPLPPPPDRILKNLHYDWFEITLTGGRIDLELADITGEYTLANVLGYFPWSLYFIEQGKISGDTLQLDYQVYDRNVDMDLEGIYEEKVEGELDEKFWKLIYETVLQLREEDDRHELLMGVLNAIYTMSMEQTAEEQLQVISRHAGVFENLDAEFVRDYVRTTLFSVSELDVTNKLCQTLLEVSKKLLNLEYTELAKLAEGTVLEFALQLETKEHRHDILMELTQRSMMWGTSHLIGYIQTIVGLFNPADHDLLLEIIDTVRSNLSQTWEGSVCLMEAYTAAGHIQEAVKLRFEASEKIGDKVTKAEDIFSATIESIDQDIEEETLYTISKEFLENAIDILHKSPILIDQIELLISASLQHGSAVFLTYILRLVRQSLQIIDPGLHDSLIDCINEYTEEIQSILYPFLELQLLNFQILTENAEGYEMSEIVDRAYQYLGIMFNSINPNSEDAPDLIFYIAHQLIYYASMIGQWSIIEETYRRVSLLMDGAEKRMASIYMDVAMERVSLSKKRLDHNDIAIRLFNESLQLHQPDDEKELLEKLTKIKQLVIKTNSYSAFTNLVISEIHIKKQTDLPWINRMIDDVKVQIRRGNTVDANIIFMEALNMDISQSEELEVLNAQLDLAETELDLLTAEEIYEKRMRILELIDSGEEDPARILKNYRDGISELLSKGEIVRLNQMVLQAIEFVSTHQIGEIREFEVIILDSYDSMVEEYRETLSDETYYLLLRVFRRTLQKFEVGKSIIFDIYQKIVEVNLLLHDTQGRSKYLRRCSLLTKELAGYLDVHDAHLEFTEVKKSSFIDLLDRVFTRISDKHPEFGFIEGTETILPLYSQIGMFEQAKKHLNSTISTIKSTALSDPGAISLLLIGIIMISQLFTSLDIGQNSEKRSFLRNKANQLANILLTVDPPSKIVEEIRRYQSGLRNNLETTLQEFPFSIAKYINALDMI